MNPTGKLDAQRISAIIAKASGRQPAPEESAGFAGDSRALPVMRTQTFYEHAGILLPGVLIAFGLLLFVPEVAAVLSVGDFTLGDLGLFVLVAYASGYVVASVGTMLEHAFWSIFGGPPADLPSRKQQLLTRREIETLTALTAERFGAEGEEVRIIAGEQWPSVYERIQRFVMERGNPRLAALAGDYALSRSFAAAFLVLTLVVAAFAPTYMRGWAWGTAALAGLNLFRMYRAGIAHAKEVLRAFIGAREEQASATLVEPRREHT